LNEKSVNPKTNKKQKVNDQDCSEIESDSECEKEEIEHEMEVALMEVINSNSHENEKDEDEVEEISTHLEIDDKDIYENAECGEEDPSIILGSLILVYWNLENKWFKGKVLRWNKEQKQYEIEYEGEENEEPMLEHLTGPSKEKWEFARQTRKVKRKTSKGHAYKVFWSFLLLSSLVPFFLISLSSFFIYLLLSSPFLSFFFFFALFYLRLP
jgi:hypothetical protein